MFIVLICFYLALSVNVANNVSHIFEGVDSEVLNCYPSINVDRCTKLDLTIEPPLLVRCC